MQANNNTQGKNHQEVELKLTVAPADAARLAEHPLLQQHAIAPPHTEDLVSTYFDTPDQRLRQRGAALRVRQTGHGCIQTLKTDDAGQAGLMRRNEIEARIAGPGIDLAALRAGIGKHGAWRKLLHSQSLADALHPLFDTRVRRTVWELRMPDGAEIEAALDHGAIECGGTREEIAELELELKAGDPAALHRIALELLDSVPLQLAGSKAERGYARCDSDTRPRPPFKFRPLHLDRNMTVDQTFRAVADACLAQVLGNAEGVMHGVDPEHVHQMRVGIRRLRSSLALFRKVAPLPAELDEELRWLGTQLGAARDWEVLAHTTLRAVQDSAPPDLAELGLPHAAEGVADGKRAEAAAALQSPHYTRLILSFQHWLHSEEWRRQAPQWQLARLDAPIQRFADAELDRAERRLLKRARRLKGADAPTRHQARIAAKKARYTIEFFQSLYAPHEVKDYVAALSDLQDELGRLNDAAVADGLLKELAGRHVELTPAAAFARGHLAKSVEDAEKPLLKRWKRFEKMALPHKA